MSSVSSLCSKILVVNIILVTFFAISDIQAAFKHDVSPSCPASEDVCNIELRVNYIMSMMSYNWSAFQGFPVDYNNGTFYKKISKSVGSTTHVCDQIPLTEDELEEVLTVDGNYKFMFAINNQFPAPTLVFHDQQVVSIRVYNDMSNEAVSFHWHGMFQTGSPWMDGVSMVSQCPIQPGEFFTYQFVASPPGTHWYHSHHGAMRRSGLAGAFIVLPKEGNEREDIPPVDKDVVFLAQDWQAAASDIEVVKEMAWLMYSFSKSSGKLGTQMRTYDGSISSLTHPISRALVNGKTKSFSASDTENEKAVPMEIFNVTQNGSLLLRIIQTGMTGEYKISIDQHRLLLVGSDGGDLIPTWIDYLIINPGETYDVMVFGNNTLGNYWIRLETTEVFDFFYNPIQPNVSFAQLHYQEAEVALPDSEKRECTVSEPCVMANCHWSPDALKRWEPNTKCVPINEVKSTPKSVAQIPVPIPTSENDFQEVFLNFHFSGSDLISPRPAVNTIHYKGPPVPLQLYPNIVNDQTVVCNNQDMTTCGDYCQCTHVVKLSTTKVTQIVLMAEDGLSTGTAHPVHLHGNRYYVVKYGVGVINETSGLLQGPNQDIEYSPDYRSAKWRNSSWNNGNIPDMNVKDPPLKDTVVIPYKGYVVLRLKTENPGFWLMHCHLETHMSVGMAVVIQVGDPMEMPKLPDNFPMCSSYPAYNEPDSKSKSDSGEKSGSNHMEDDALLQLPSTDGGSTKSQSVGNSYHRDDYSMMNISVGWFVLMMILMVLFVFGFCALSLVLISRHCTWTFPARSRRGYHDIDTEERVVFSK